MSKLTRCAVITCRHWRPHYLRFLRSWALPAPRLPFASAHSLYPRPAHRPPASGFRCVQPQNMYPRNHSCYFYYLLSRAPSLLHICQALVVSWLKLGCQRTSYPSAVHAPFSLHLRRILARLRALSKLQRCSQFTEKNVATVPLPSCGLPLRVPCSPGVLRTPMAVLVHPRKNLVPSTALER